MTTNYGSPITGTIDATASAVVNVTGLLTPSSTLVLNSSAEGAAMAFSLDGGTLFYSITPTGTQTGQKYFVLTFPVTNIGFAGAEGDTWAIL
jgi:hypothetical protein